MYCKTYFMYSLLSNCMMKFSFVKSVHFAFDCHIAYHIQSFISCGGEGYVCSVMSTIQDSWSSRNQTATQPNTCSTYGNNVHQIAIVFIAKTLSAYLFVFIMQQRPLCSCCLFHPLTLGDFTLILDILLSTRLLNNVLSISCDFRWMP